MSTPARAVCSRYSPEEAEAVETMLAPDTFLINMFNTKKYEEN
jgi:hypothetical protein